MRIAVCDDDGKARAWIKERVRRAYGSLDVNYVIDEFASSEEMTPDALGGYDLIFMDIDMPGMDGLEIVGLIRARQRDMSVSIFGSLPLIVFITGYAEYMSEAFKVHAFDYLVKPVSDETFDGVLTRAYDFISDATSDDVVLDIHSAGEVYAVASGDIVYAESSGRKNIIVMTDESVLAYYGSMAELEGRLPTSFFRIHKGYIVNMAHIISYDRVSVTISTGAVLMMSKYRYADFVSAYMSYLKSMERAM